MGVQIIMKDIKEKHFKLIKKYFAEDGLLEKQVYALLGIKENTWYFWKRTARKIEESLSKGETKEKDLDEGQKKALRFVALCDIGRAEVVKRNIGYIQTAAKEPAHWHAAAWYLERTEPDQFGKKQNINVKGHLGITQVELTEEEEQQYKNNLDAFFGKDD